MSEFISEFVQKVPVKCGKCGDNGYLLIDGEPVSKMIQERDEGLYKARILFTAIVRHHDEKCFCYHCEWLQNYGGKVE